MKQFIVDRHTTPNTPTLEQVPTEKIPIYENRAAVTADLANLSVGQIVATKDTGDELAHPVNVVESGNLHAVSSNAVARMFDDNITIETPNSTQTSANCVVLNDKLIFVSIEAQSVGTEILSGSVLFRLKRNNQVIPIGASRQDIYCFNYTGSKNVLLYAPNGIAEFLINAPTISAGSIWCLNAFIKIN